MGVVSSVESEDLLTDVAHPSCPIDWRGLWKSWHSVTTSPVHLPSATLAPLEEYVQAVVLLTCIEDPDAKVTRTCNCADSLVFRKR